MRTRSLYKFYLDYGRMGVLDGIFITTDEDVQKAMGGSVYWGDALGKHGDVSFELEENHLSKFEVDQAFIDKLEEVFGDTDISGYNPVSHILENMEDEDVQADYEDEGDEES